MLSCAKMGIDITIACPRGYEPQKSVIRMATRECKRNCSTLEIVNNPLEGVNGADVIYTDVWISMGKECEYRERVKAFKNFQVNKNILRLAKKDAIVMHCLPAMRGLEITNDVIDGKHSVVYEQAENRLHLQKALILFLLNQYKDLL